MQMTTLGKTGMKVTRLGAGLATLGLHLSASAMEEAGRVLNQYLDSGINFLDTAPCYGIAEEAIGRSISQRRDDYFLATKCGHGAGGFYALTGRPWSADTIRAGVERSLKAMSVEYVDLLQLHSCNIHVLERGAAVEALLGAKEAGKTRFVGYSGDGDEALWAINSGLFDTLQTTFNLLDQRADDSIIPLAAEKGMGIIIKRPIANGAWGATEPPAAGADDLGEPATLIDYFERGRAMAEDGPIPGAPEDPITLAMGFVFAHARVHTAIVGSRNPAHIRSNIEMLDNRLPIAREAVDELHKRFQDVGYYWTQQG